jgi:hypothetical protein
LFVGYCAALERTGVLDYSSDEVDDRIVERVVGLGLTACLGLLPVADKTLRAGRLDRDTRCIPINQTLVMYLFSEAFLQKSLLITFKIKHVLVIICFMTYSKNVMLI